MKLSFAKFSKWAENAVNVKLTTFDYFSTFEAFNRYVDIV